MPQFDVFTNPSPGSRRFYPFVVSLQSELADTGSADRIVAPLALRRDAPGAASRLMPVVRIDEEEYVVFTRTLTTVPATILAHRVANLSRHRAELLGAVDLLFYGV